MAYQGSTPIGYVDIFEISATGLFGTQIDFTDDSVTATQGLIKNVAVNIVGHPNKGNLTITLDNKIDNEEIQTFFDTYLNNVEVVKTPVKYTDSSIDYLISGVDASTPFGFICYAGSHSSKVKTYVGRGILTGDTGNVDYAPDSAGNHIVAIEAITGLAIDIPITSFDSSLVSGINVTLANDVYGSIVMLTAA